MRRYLTAATLGLAANASQAQDGQPTNKMVTILASEEPQTQLMSMVLTMQPMQAGADAYVLRCGPAGDLALKRRPNPPPPRRNPLA